MTAEYNSQSDFEDIDSLNKRCIREALYLVTYSQVDEGRCSDRERFVEIVLEAFDLRKENSVQPVQSVSKEPHSESGFHNHMCVKLLNNKRWFGAKGHFLVNYNIIVHFSDSHQNYISAYRYVTKEGTEVFQSPGHPELHSTRSPQTSEANKALTE